MHPSEESIDDVLRYARRHGQRPTRTQIRRFQQNGLIPKPRQVGLGRGVGTEVRYPSGTGLQLVAACKANKSGSFRIARWRLWWDRWPIEASWINKDLLAHIQESQKRDRTPREVRRRLNELQLKQLRELEEGRRKGVLPESIGEKFEQLITRGFNAEFLIPLSKQSGPLPPLGDLLLMFLRLTSVQNLKIVVSESTKNGELEEVRDEVRTVLDQAEALGRFLEIMGMPRAFCRSLAKSMQSPAIDVQATVLVIWLAVRNIPTVRAIHAWVLAQLGQSSSTIEPKRE